MKLSVHRSIRLALFLGALVFCAPGRAANVVLDLLGNGNAISEDARYRDGESMVISTTKGGLNATFSGMNYGDDPIGIDRWGLLDASRPWNRGKSGAMLRNGFAPNAVGSTEHTYSIGKGATATVEASYLSITIQKSTQTMFSSIQVNLQGSTMIVSANAWAGTSMDGFSSAITPSTGNGNGNAQGRPVSWSFDNLDFSGDGPLEIRLYGIAGGDSADLSKLQVHVGTAAVPVPEPAVTSLLVASLFILTRRRRGR